MRGHASTTVVLILTVLIALPAASARAADYTEGAIGQPDLSGSGSSPTNWNLSAGSNKLTGQTGSGDTDIVHINIPTGLQLSQITLDAYGAADLSFLGMKIGSTWPGNPNSDGQTNGYVHMSPGLVGTNVLDDIAAASGGTVTAPLSGSDYTFWIQNATGAPTPYSLSFVVPEPAGVALLAVAGLTMLGRPRRR